MDLEWSVEDLAFRSQVQSFLATHLPQDLRDSHWDRVGLDILARGVRRWQTILGAHGYGAIHWPTAFGGWSATPLQQYLFDLECIQAGAPIQLAFGIRMIGPVLMRFGSPTQQEYFLPRILNGEHWWCQGYSEPGAGSDLASLRTSATREGEAYVVNGQKCWNTLGQFADWIFCLVKTDSSVKPQRGISLLLIDMKTPGITVRPTLLLDGTAEVNEIFFENVRVPVENRVGEENQGWTYAKYLLTHERSDSANIIASKQSLLRLKILAAQQTMGGRALIDHPSFRRRLIRMEMDLLALEYTNLRLLSAPSVDAANVSASMLKVRSSEVRQLISELLVEAAGVQALAFSTVEGDGSSPSPTQDLAAAYLNLRKLSIFGGSNEIQRNIISQSLLRM
jgi:alkylation response protein AidB-like acyl-CoA dehydrogenase